MSEKKRRPDNSKDLDDPRDRGEASQEGFGDYDEEFHPADVDTSDEPPVEDRNQSKKRNDDPAREPR